MPLVGPVDYRSLPVLGVRTALTGYYMSPIVTASSTAVTILAGRLYFQPFYLPNQVVDRIGIEVTTGSAGSARLGLYTHNGTDPASLIIDCGTVDTTSNAIVEASFTATSLPAGWCWAGVVFEVTPGCRGGTPANSALIGVASPSTGLRGFLGVQAYGALPSTAPSFSGAGTNIPMILLRKS